MKSFFLNISSAWNDVASRILQGKSVLFRAPKNSGKNFFCSMVLKKKRVNEIYTIVRINLNEVGSKEINFDKVLEEFRTSLQFERKKNGKGNNQADFKKAILSIRVLKKILIVVESNSQNKHLTIQFLNTFQELFHENKDFFRSNFVLFVHDDLSLYFYELRISPYSSLWDFFSDRINLYQITDEEFGKRLLNSNQYLGNFKKEYYSTILKLTGGHYGLICKALLFLSTNNKQNNFNTWGKECKEYLLKTKIMTSLTKSLIHKNKDYFDLAFTFKNKRLSDLNHENNIIEELHVNGVLLKINGSYSKLCPGLITETVERIYYEKFKTPSEKKAPYFASKSTNNESLLPNQKKIILLTAIKEEFQALETVFSKSSLTKRIESSNYLDANYIKWELNKANEISSVYLFKAGKRNNKINAITSNIFKTYSPDILIFLGTAGCLNSSKCKIGDIIIPCIIKNYQHETNVTKKNRKYAPDNHLEPTTHLLGVARSLNCKSTLNKIRSIQKQGYSDNYNIFDGDDHVVMSGDKTIEDYNIPEVRKIKDENPKALALEQEGFGFLMACKYAREEKKELEYLVIRVISDYLNNKALDNERDSKALTCTIASIYVLELIKKLNGINR